MQHLPLLRCTSLWFPFQLLNSRGKARPPVIKKLLMDGTRVPVDKVTLEFALETVGPACLCLLALEPVLGLLFVCVGPATLCVALWRGPVYLR